MNEHSSFCSKGFGPISECPVCHNLEIGIIERLRHEAHKKERELAGKPPKVHPPVVMKNEPIVPEVIVVQRGRKHTSSESVG